MDFEIKNSHKEKKKKQKQKDKKLIILAVFFLLLSIVLMIIYFSMDNNTKNNYQPSAPKVTKEPVIEKIKIVDPDSQERPIAIMIDNNIGSALHAGLQDSYLNYEMIVEGGLTRIMSLYKDKNVSLIGPVRSSRHYFLDYALESDVIYTHFGWSAYAENDIKVLNVKNINGLTDEQPFWRDTSAKAPHNVFTSTDKIRNYLQQKGYSDTSNNWQLLNYKVDEISLNEIPNATPATKISIDYSYYQNRSYNYDSENKYYLRSMNGSAHLDKVSNSQLHYKNVIIEKVNNVTLDNEGRQDLATVGTGTGYYITNGYSLPIKWSKTSRTAKTKYTYNDGTEIKVNDGNTFIQIVPTTSNIVIE